MRKSVFLPNGNNKLTFQPEKRKIVMDWKKNWTIIHDPEKVKERAVPFAFDVAKELVTGEMYFDSKNKVIYTSIPVEK